MKVLDDVLAGKDPSEPVSMMEVARAFRGNYHVWLRRALRGTRGVKLESFMVGGRRMTTWGAVGRFLRVLNGDKPETAQRGSSSAIRSQVASRFLDEIGL